jgi:hypothetical protein
LRAEVPAKLTASRHRAQATPYRAAQRSTAQHSAAQRSTAQHIAAQKRAQHELSSLTLRCTHLPTGTLGRYPPDLKGYGLSRTWQCEEGGPPRNRRRSALRVFVNVRLPRPHSFNGCHEATTDIHGWPLCFAFPPRVYSQPCTASCSCFRNPNLFFVVCLQRRTVDEHLALIHDYPGTWDRGNMT